MVAEEPLQHLASTERLEVEAEEAEQQQTLHLQHQGAAAAVAEVAVRTQHHRAPVAVAAAAEAAAEEALRIWIRPKRDGVDLRRSELERSSGDLRKRASTTERDSVVLALVGAPACGCCYDAVPAYDAALLRS